VKGIKISRYEDTFVRGWPGYGGGFRRYAVQISIYKLELIASKYGLKFLKIKAKSIAFKERDLVRSKFVINSDIIDEINTFTYLGCPISYQNEADIAGKIIKILTANGNT
jgi:hypothetical protein